jgi:hypothetical protein
VYVVAVAGERRVAHTNAAVNKKKNGILSQAGREEDEVEE